MRIWSKRAVPGESRIGWLFNGVDLRLFGLTGIDTADGSLNSVMVACLLGVGQGVGDRRVEACGLLKTGEAQEQEGMTAGGSAQQVMFGPGDY